MSKYCKPKNVFLIVSVLCFFTILTSCKRKAFSEEKFIIEKPIIVFFQTFKTRDTLFFKNYDNNIDTFLITKIDSTINNDKNFFINSRYQKQLYIEYKEIPINYWSISHYEVKEEKEIKINENARLLTITKYPDNNKTEIYFTFKNFHYLTSDTLDLKLNKDTVKIGNQNFSNYYKLYASSDASTKDSTEIRTVLITSEKGIIAYQDMAGRWTTRLN